MPRAAPSTNAAPEHNSTAPAHIDRQKNNCSGAREECERRHSGPFSAPTPNQRFGVASSRPATAVSEKSEKTPSTPRRKNCAYSLRGSPW